MVFLKERNRDKNLFLHTCMISGGMSSGESSSKSENYEKMTPAQKAEYDKLTSGASDWLDQGGLKQDNTVRDQMSGLYGDMTSELMNTINGQADTGALESMLDMQRVQGNENLRSSLANVQAGGNQTGGAAGSRTGIASGLATSGANRQMADAQNRTIYDWQNQQDQNKSQAIGQLGQVAQGYGNMNDMYRSGSQEALDSLAAYKSLISGDMGGESSGYGSQTGKSKSYNLGFDPSAAMSGAATALSDERLKKGVKSTGKKVRVSKTGAEIPEKEFEYTDSAKKEFGAPDGKHKGVMAQDLEKEDPSAVSEMTSSTKKKKKRKAVDYNKLSKAFDSI